MNHYYVLVETARELLTFSGHDTVSQEVLDAQRSAATSGEAIEAVGVVLKRALLLDLDTRTREAVQQVLDEGSRLRAGANG